jgi:hypothetical protein
MNKCKRCGAKTSNTECIDCRYRAGGKLQEVEHSHRPPRRMRERFRSAFSWAQLDQVSPSER